MAREAFSKTSTEKERLEAHHSQVAKQIWLPLILALVVVLFLVVIIFIGTVRGSDEISRWANISVVYLLIPNILISLLMIVLFIFIIRGMVYLMTMMPGWLITVQGFFSTVSATIRQGCDRLAAPVISINSASQGVSGGFRAVFKRKNMSNSSRGTHER
jgi:membrane-associated HD superfamily phosphohydrolase